MLNFAATMFILLCRNNMCVHADDELAFEHGILTDTDHTSKQPTSLER